MAGCVDDGGALADICCPQAVQKRASSAFSRPQAEQKAHEWHPSCGRDFGQLSTSNRYLMASRKRGMRNRVSRLWLAMYG